MVDEIGTAIMKKICRLSSKRFFDPGLRPSSRRLPHVDVDVGSGTQTKNGQKQAGAKSWGHKAV